MRKKYLDNIRWITILFVVVFHIYFYYNNIDIAAMFEGVKDFDGSVTFAGLYQYFVYPWFMLLLFIVAGMSARYALKIRTNREFYHSRVDKLLVPSTLGVLAFGWVGGMIVYLHNAKPTIPAGTPGFVGVIIALCSGIGALWFCHVLFVATLVLLLIRWIVKKTHGSEEQICGWFSGLALPSQNNVWWKSPCLKLGILFAVCYLILWGGSHVLNMPLITSYRNGIYIPAFLMGYYIFSNDAVIEKLKKAIWPMLALAALTGVFYLYRCYGMEYGSIAVLSRWDLNLYAFCMVLFALGAGANYLEFSNAFTEYMQKCSWGIYVLHIPVLLVTNYLLIGSGLPMTVIYLIELVSAFVFSVLLYEVFRRIPILRYWILGIRKKRI